jgi:hypothetical protein
VSLSPISVAAVDSCLWRLAVGVERWQVRLVFRSDDGQTGSYATGKSLTNAGQKSASRRLPIDLHESRFWLLGATQVERHPGETLLLSYCTTRVKEVPCESEPLVAVTVTL